MPIIRSEHDFEESFTRLPNRWLRDDRLSLKAIGLLAQLQSHSVGWKISVNTLAKTNRVGIDYIRGAISELEEAGYLIRTQERDQRNRFGESFWRTADPTNTPSSGFPSSAFPSSENPTTKKNNVKNEQEEEIIALFSNFWKIYPRKVAVASARKAFYKVVTLEMGKQVLEGATRLANDPNLPSAQFIPYPATWINREGWNDDPYPERQLSPAEKQQQAIANQSESMAKRRKESAEYLEQLKAEAANAAPPPECEHGTSLARCSICTRIMAQND
jgi:hypothetical protein